MYRYFVRGKVRYCRDRYRTKIPMGIDVVLCCTALLCCAVGYEWSEVM